MLGKPRIAKYHEDFLWNPLAIILKGDLSPVRAEPANGVQGISSGKIFCTTLFRLSENASLVNLLALNGSKEFDRKKASLGIFEY